MQSPTTPTGTGGSSECGGPGRPRELPETLAGIDRIDIGCGRRSEVMAGCVGIDINRKYEPDLVWDCDQGLPFDDGSLVFVNSDNSLEHFRHPYFIVEECFRCLEVGGRLRVVVPNVQYLPTLLLAFVRDVDRYFHWYMSLPHKRERTVHRTLFTKHTVRRTAEEIGFRVVRTWGWLYSKEVGAELEKPGR